MKMAKPKYTPGNWYAVTGDDGGIIDQATVCSDREKNGEPMFLADTMGLGDPNDVPLEQRKANARMFAASKDLYLAAKKMLQHLNARIDAAPSNSKPVFHGIVELHAAINKADGVQ
jgi:hypothetical protein